VYIHPRTLYSKSLKQLYQGITLSKPLFSESLLCSDWSDAPPQHVISGSGVLVNSYSQFFSDNLKSITKSITKDTPHTSVSNVNLMLVIFEWIMKLLL